MRRFSLIVSLTLSAFTAFAAGEDPAPPASAARGAAIFQTMGCAACHGTRGAGGGNAGPRLAPNPMPYQALLAIVRNPIRQMPPFSERVFTKQDAIDIHAFLASIPPGRRASEIPILSRIVVDP